MSTTLSVGRARGRAAARPRRQLVIFAFALASRGLAAQMPAVPTLQNAFANPGFTAAGNIGRADDATAYGLAAAWAPGGARFVVSGGVGGMNPDAEAGGGTHFAAGLRVAVPVWRNAAGSFGAAAFGGAGGAWRSRTGMTVVPVGVSVGYRRVLGERFAVSVYGAPFYAWHRTDLGDETQSASLFRGSVGLDVGFSPRFGATFGVELGGEADTGDPGPRSPVYGVGVSVALSGR
ncbi:MAG TPA: hypothetical protein VNA89_09405 [Gemmatimonadaceae bacterium]|nr:hypothetical protein [Gemmatimonadaceae bacterium]